MRKNYIDNLRWLCVLLLFPYHILMIYNSWGENFYIKGMDIKATSTFMYVTWPWFMPLLFTVAGISTAYAMRDRSIGEFVKERISKLLIPLIAGILLIIPVQTYFAERYHNGYDGGYFEQYILFFTKLTDFTGYDGGFTPGQLWFILYLFVISMFAIPLIILSKKKMFDLSKLPTPVMLCLFILPLIGSLVLNIGGKSLGEYFMYFMLGYFLLSNDNIQKRLEEQREPMLLVSVLCLAFTLYEWISEVKIPWPTPDIIMRLNGWVTIMALLGYSRKYMNVSNRITSYMSRSSFSVYMFHQSWIVAAAYYVFKLTGSPPMQMLIILLISVAATFATYEICRRLRITRFMFAIKK